MSKILQAAIAAGKWMSMQVKSIIKGAGAVAMLALCSLASAAGTINYYETFNGFVGGGVGVSSFGTDVNGNSFTTFPSGGASIGYSSVSGYPDDASVAVNFSSKENKDLQSINGTDIGTVPYVASFAMKWVDNASTASYTQVFSLANFDSGFRTIFNLEIVDEDWVSPGSQSQVAFIAFDAISGNVSGTTYAVPGVIEGGHNFSADGSQWNVIFISCDPLTSNLKVWVNPTSSSATADFDSSFSFGSALSPVLIAYGPFTFLPDTTPVTGKSVTVDSTKITSGGTDAADNFATAFNSYSFNATVSDWCMY